MTGAMRHLRSLFAVAIAAAALITGGCATNMSAPWADLGAPGKALPTPTLSPGDKLRVTVFDEPNLSGTFEVGADGHVAMPLLGRVRASGLTLDAFRRALNRRLADGFLKNPRTTIDVLNYRPVFVHGEVRRGGEYPFKAGLTFRDAIAVAGGYTYRAQEGYVLLMRAGQREPVKVRMPSTALVQPGDNIRVPERFF
ncbi:MAG: polysaccharide biosynthesis/export family protein [Pseudomonadota bacterium]